MFSTVFVLNASLAADPAQELIATIKSLKKVSFEYKRSLDYPENGYHNEIRCSAYGEFGDYPHAGARFLFKFSDSVLGYNGTTLWNDQGAKSWKDTGKKLKHGLESTAPLKNSIFGLVTCLEFIAKGKDGVVKILSDSKFEFQLKGKEISVFGLIPVEYSPRYVVQIDPKLKLPVSITQYLGNPKDTIRTDFSNWNVNPKSPAEKAWTPN